MSPLRTSLLCVAALCGTRIAAAWDGSATFTAQLAPADFTPSALSVPDAHGFWAAGLANDAPLLVRYDLAGVPQLVRYVQGELGHTDITIAAMPDGGVVERDLEGYVQPHCVLRRYDANGGLRWASPAAHSDDPVHDAFCGQPTIDAAGGVWVRADGLQRIGNDGALEARFAGDGTTVVALVGDSAGANVYALGFANDANANKASAVVEKISEHGTVLWKYVAPQSLGDTRMSAAEVDAAGNVYAFGTVALASGQGVYGVKLSASGELAWQHADTSANTTSVGAVAATSDGNAYVLFVRPGSFAFALSRTTSTGAFAWTTDTDFARCSSYPPDLRAAANGDAVFASACPDQNGAAQLALQRVSATGAQAFSTRIANAVPSFLQVLPDSSSVLVETHPILVDANGLPVLDANGQPVSLGYTVLEHTAADGSALAALRTTQLGTALARSALSTFGNDGSAYLLVESAVFNQYELARITPDGHVAWRVPTGDTLDSYYRELLVVGDAVCTIDTDDLHCFATASGASKGAMHFSELALPTSAHAFARALRDGQLLLLAPDDSGVHSLLLDTNGVRLNDTLLPYGSYRDVSINDSGLSLAITGDTSYASYDAHGTLRYSRTTAASGMLTQTYISPDGSGLLVAGTADTAQLTGVDAAGAVRWTHAIALPMPDADGEYRLALIIQQHGDDIYALFGLGGELYVDQAPRFAYILQRMSLATGAIAWSTTVDGTLLRQPFLRVSPDGAHLLVITDETNRLHTRLLNAADGKVARDRIEACDADRCALSSVEVTGDGALRAVVDASADASGNFQRMFVRAQAFASSAPIRADQSAIGGAWFAPYSAGQGFVLDYIAGARTVFMPWFAYAPAGRNDPAALQWYALQGGVAPGAPTSVDLTITTPDPGAFDEGAVAVRAVGNATLSFENCNSGTLVYRFDADVNNGAAGSITLTRLLPTTAPCVLADGSIVPAQLPNAPARGFDALQSGSWFEPSTAGQGLQTIVLPPGNGSNGFVFAAWFTFDPSGKADDAAQQHWFTLQGDLASASDGKVQLPILRTLGGTLDGTPTSNTQKVGTATLTFHGCDSAQLDYLFDYSDVAHAFAGLAGSINLSKIGGCAAH